MLREGLQRLDQAQAEAKKIVSARRANLEIIGGDFPWPQYDRSGYALELYPPNPQEVRTGLIIGIHTASDKTMVVVEPTGMMFSIPFTEKKSATTDQIIRVLQLDERTEVGIDEYEAHKSNVSIAAEGWRKYDEHLHLPPPSALSAVR